MTDAPRFLAPATARNRDPILEVLRRVLPGAGTVLELAAGTGDHAAYFAAALPGLVWQPTEADPRMLPEIEACRREAVPANLRPAAPLAIAGPGWADAAPDGGPFAGIVAINLLHIAPWAVAEALFAGVDRALTTDGVLFLYGPYRRGGAHTAPSNTRFDAMLRGHDPAWGVRDLEAVASLAESAGLHLAELAEMPANNLSLVFRRAHPDSGGARSS